MIDTLKSVFDLFRQAFKEWNEDKAPRLAAALAYYTAFSIAPLLVVTISLVGLVFSGDSIEQQIIAQVNSSVGETAGELVAGLIESASQPAEGIISAVLGTVTLLLGAIGVFSNLQDSLNTIWDANEQPSGGILYMIRSKLLSFGMLLIVGFLLLVSLVISTAVSSVESYATGLVPAAEVAIRMLNFGISFAIVAALFALIFKYLPDVHIEWRDVWIGAAFTSFLFSVGKYLLGLYLANSSTASAYGAAGSFVLILLWVYYSAQIMLFGAEFTQVYARRYGSRILPEGSLAGSSHAGSEEVTEPATIRGGSRVVPAQPAPENILSRKVEPVRSSRTAVEVEREKSNVDRALKILIGALPLILGIIGSLLPQRGEKA